MCPESLLIIPSYITEGKDAQILTTCIETIRQSTNDPVIVIDDGSPSKELVEILFANYREQYKNVNTIEKTQNEGFSTTVNIGLQVALNNGLDACLVNADIEFREKNWLNHMKDSDAAVVGGLLLYPSLLIQHAGIYFSRIARGFDHRFKGAPPNLPAAHYECDCPVTGALQYIRHEVLEDVGLYDDEFKMGWEDVDFMIRAIDKGHRSLYNPKVTAIHHESIFRSKKSDKVKRWESESFARLLKKYRGKDFADIAPTL